MEDDVSSAVSITVSIGSVPVAVELDADALSTIAGALSEAGSSATATTASPYLSGWRAAADYVGVSRSCLAHDPTVPRRKIGGAVVFRRDELDAWLDARFEGSRRFRRAQQDEAGSRAVPFRPISRSRDSDVANKNPA